MITSTVLFNTTNVWGKVLSLCSFFHFNREVVLMGDRKKRDCDITMEETFAAYSEILSTERENYEEILKCNRELQTVARSISFLTNKIQSHANDEKKMITHCKAALVKFADLHPVWTNMKQVIQASHNHHERFRNLWHSITVNLVFQAALCQWIISHELITKESVEELIMGDQQQQDGDEKTIIINIDIEEYLQGLVLLPKELSRLCVNSIRCGNYTLPPLIQQFVAELYSGFRLLNLKNDGLRRKFDAIKYDVQKLEEVMYDMAVRKLGSESTE